ncbi:methyl-accepting chemotaxis protein [Paracoccus nototheniae]|uniref:methyl-accepting chemotaxis protein n=1 Tax=Paracoccus nototheniae TaxID=2489002 RepID=UPI001F60754C|nr:methyl-accepting chemotaxis protein [Paracoccus nototheniae]
MLKNVTIARQVWISFSLIQLMLVLFAALAWARLDSLRTVQSEMLQASDLALTAASVSEGIAEAAPAIDRLSRLGAQAGADDLTQPMQTLRHRAETIRQASAPEADQLLVLLDRQQQDLGSLTEAATRQTALIAQARNSDNLQDGLQQRIDQLAALASDGAQQIAAWQASAALSAVQMRTERYLTSLDQARFDGAEAALRDLQAQLTDLEGGGWPEPARALLASIRAGLAGDWQVVGAIRAAQPALDAQRIQIADSMAEAATLSDAIRETAVSTKAVLDGQATDLARQTAILLLAGAAVVVLLGSAIAMVLARGLGEGLTRTVDQTRRLAEGDHDVDITGTADRHELGALARALTVLSQNARERQRQTAEADQRSVEISDVRDAEMAEQARVVRDIGDALNRLAGGDLTTQITSTASDPFPKGYESLRKAFNSVIATLSGTVTRIADVADQVRGGSDEITSAARDLSSRAETQAATLEQSAAALNQMSESVRSTAERARQAEQASQQNREIAETSSAIVRDAVTAMKGIEKSSDQITRIIGVIDDIAFQTNLLALNAGVEAARAGDAGRGFAVVASEVRGLAQRASASAREIKELISDSATQVKAGSSLVGRTGESLDLILGRAREVSEQISAIARAAGEQAIGLSEINAGVNHLDQVTQQNAAVAEEANAAAVSLQQRSEDLMREISGFRVNGAARAPSARTTRPARADHAPVPLRVVAGRGDAAAQMYEF